MQDVMQNLKNKTEFLWINPKNSDQDNSKFSISDI